MQSSLDRLYTKTLAFLEKEKIPYLLIGGLAAGVLGEPRTEKWAQKLSDEAEDLRIWNTLKKLLS